MKNAPAKCFYGAFLPFAFHAKAVLATSAISYSFGCVQRLCFAMETARSTAVA